MKRSHADMEEVSQWHPALLISRQVNRTATVRFGCGSTNTEASGGGSHATRGTRGEYGEG